jgi:adenylate cyclase
MILGLVTAACLVLVAISPTMHRVENQYGLGLLYLLRGPVPAPSGAVIVAVDGDTIEWLRALGRGDSHPPATLRHCLSSRFIRELAHVRGPGDLPRATHACLLRNLLRLGVPVVAFDILFAVPGDAEGDSLLAQALRAHGTTALLVGFRRSTIVEHGAELLVDREIQPFALLRESAAAVGAFPVTRTRGPTYGYLRQLPRFNDTGSLIDAALFLRSPALASTSSAQSGMFRYLWHYGPAGTIDTISMRAVLTDEVPEEFRLKARRSVAFVGASDPRSANFPDTFASFFPGRFGAEVSGVELAATAFLNQLEGHNVRRLRAAGEAALVGALGLTLSFVAFARRRFALPLILGITVLYTFAASEMFSRDELFLPIAVPVFLAAPMAFVLAIISKYRLARTLIARLAPAPVARRLLSRATVDPRGQSDAGEATVVFFDIIGSMQIGEMLPELEFRTLMNSFFEVVTGAIERHRGFVSAFAGDGLVAVFRRSEIGIEHPVQACRAVADALHDLERMNVINQARSLPALSVRVGVNSGQVAEGEIGAHDRFNFSVLGDTVNLAARLEQLGKVMFPGDRNVVLIGAATRRGIEAEDFAITDCGWQSVPGRNKEENVFRLGV